MSVQSPSWTEHTARTGDHVTAYLAAGPEDGPLIIFCHGWPELGLSWRHQLPTLAALGFRAVAPDMRGYGRSSVYDRHEDYTVEAIVGDMVGLLDHLGRERAVWVGHDWGSPIVWSVASHHPERCHGVASLCVPYRTIEQGFDGLVSLVDRSVYPEDEFPVGQWDYQLFYQENFARAQETLGANPYNTVRALFRKGDPEGRGKPTFTAFTRRNGGWFGPLDAAPDMPRDDDVVTEEDLRSYAAALERNGFFGPDSWYMNHEANQKFGERAANGGRLSMPALFLTAAYDFVCECVDSKLAEPMRAYCDNLTEFTVNSGHWMAQEKPRDVNAALVHWLATQLPAIWPRPPL